MIGACGVHLNTAYFPGSLRSLALLRFRYMAYLKYNAPFLSSRVWEQNVDKCAICCFLQKLKLQHTQRKCYSVNATNDTLLYTE